MTSEETTSLRARGKSEVAPRAEPTTAGPVFTSSVDIFETAREITLLADMPGVKPKDLTVDLDDNVLTLAGNVEPPERPNEIELLREYRMGKYFRQFNLSEVIDQPKIQAKLEDGVLRLTLPKVQPSKPRKVKIKVT
jgi:HSP20 family molecular chaperone IbpA